MDKLERIALLDQLDRDSRSSERRARWIGWGTVGAAAAVLLILLVSGGLRLQTLREQVAVEKRSLQALADERSLRLEELRETEARLEELREVVGEIDRDKVEAAYEKKAQTDPGAKQSPRVYVHIARNADRAAAQVLVKDLEKQGFVVPGIEYVESAQRLGNTQVRYFKQADSGEAGRLRDVIESSGMDQAEPTYLQRYENDPSVRANQYEVWIKPQTERTNRPR